MGWVLGRVWGCEEVEREGGVEGGIYILREYFHIPKGYV